MTTFSQEVLRINATHSQAYGIDVCEVIGLGGNGRRWVQIKNLKGRGKRLLLMLHTDKRFMYPGQVEAAGGLELVGAAWERLTRAMGFVSLTGTPPHISSVAGWQEGLWLNTVRSSNR
jgi:hypothetical protein